MFERDELTLVKSDQTKPVKGAERSLLEVLNPRTIAANCKYSEQTKPVKGAERGLLEIPDPLTIMDNSKFSAVGLCTATVGESILSRADRRDFSDYRARAARVLDSVRHVHQAAQHELPVRLTHSSAKLEMELENVASGRYGARPFFERSRLHPSISQNLHQICSDPIFNIPPYKGALRTRGETMTYLLQSAHKEYVDSYSTWRSEQRYAKEDALYRGLLTTCGTVAINACLDEMFFTGRSRSSATNLSDAISPFVACSVRNPLARIGITTALHFATRTMFDR
jgi:hypothetical protein